MAAKIRPFVSGDEPRVCAAVRAVYDEFGFTWDADEYHADLYDLTSAYGGPNEAFWVAEDGGSVVGCIGLSVFPALPGVAGSLVELDGVRRVAACDCELHRLYVIQSSRRTGTGTALFEAALTEARERGASLMELWSDKRFGDAHRLYLRYGAQIVGDRICDDPDQSPEWGLSLKLLETSRE